MTRSDWIQSRVRGGIMYLLMWFHVWSQCPLHYCILWTMTSTDRVRHFMKTLQSFAYGRPKTWHCTSEELLIIWLFNIFLNSLSRNRDNYYRDKRSTSKIYIDSGEKKTIFVVGVIDHSVRYTYQLTWDHFFLIPLSDRSSRVSLIVDQWSNDVHVLVVTLIVSFVRERTHELIRRTKYKNRSRFHFHISESRYQIYKRSSWTLHVKITNDWGSVVLWYRPHSQDWISFVTSDGAPSRTSWEGFALWIINQDFSALFLPESLLLLFGLLIVELNFTFVYLDEIQNAKMHHVRKEINDSDYFSRSITTNTRSRKRIMTFWSWSRRPLSVVQRKRRR